MVRYGLTAARLLASGGRSCLVVERRDGAQRHPAAHVVNARTLEIFRQAGFPSEAIDAIASDPADAGHVNFVTRLDGQLIGRLPFERQGDRSACNTHRPRCATSRSTISKQYWPMPSAARRRPSFAIGPSGNRASKILTA